MTSFTRRAVLAASASTLLAVSTRSWGQGAAGKKTLRVAPHAALRVLDPITTPAYVTRNHGYLIYDTLFSIDAQYRPQPQMIKDWSVSDDKLTYLFTLRDGLAFHDGAPVTAEDCVASVMRWSKRDVIGLRIAAATDTITASDARTFKIVLKQPFGPLIEAFSKPSSVPLFIMPKRIAETPADRALTDTIGSGPFKFIASEFQPGVRWVYERNTAYVPRSEPPSALSGGKVVHVDRIEAIWFPSRQTAVNALQKGEIDLIENLTPDQRSLYEGNTEIVILRKAGPNQDTIRMNWAQPPFNNLKIRQAVQAAVSQRYYMDAVVGDPASYELCGAMFGCGTTLETFAGVVNKGEPDLARAKALLKESGYNGEKVVIITPGDVPSFSALAPMTQQVLRSIGMTAEIQALEWSAFLQRRTVSAPVAEGGWHLAHGVFDRLDMISPLGNPNFDARGKIAYTGFIDDPETEALKTRYQNESDPAKQKAIAEAMQKRAYEQVFYIPIGTYFDDLPMRANIKNYIPSPIMVLWGVEKV